MRVVARSLGIIVLALFGAIALAASWTMTTAVQLLATTAFIMGGVGHPLVNPNGVPEPVGSNLSYPLSEPGYADGYVVATRDNYIAPSGSVRGDSTNPADYNLVAVYTPAEFFPVYGTKTMDDSVAEGAANLDACVEGDDCVAHIYPDGPGTTSTYVVVGHSLGALTASLVKRDLIERYQDDPDESPDTSVILLANAMRPNGGVLARGFKGLTIPFLEITFYGATPTNTCQTTDGQCYRTVDVAQQYDALGGDFPVEPLNLLALANSIAAFVYLHGDVPNVGMDEALFQGQKGDTSYYMIPAEILPILRPLQDIGVPKAILLVADAPMRVMIEKAYARDVNPGEPTPFRFLPSGNPITYIGNLAGSIPVGIDDGFDEAGLGRPFNTPDVDRYFGVGGPPLPAPPPAAPLSDGPEADVAVERSALEPAAVERAADEPKREADAVVVETEETKDEETKDEETKDEETKDEETKDEETKDEETKDEETKDEVSTREITRPRPLQQILRGPIDFKRPKQPPADRVSGDRPLQRIAKALTGQRPKAESADTEKTSTPDPKPADGQDKDNKDNAA